MVFYDFFSQPMFARIFSVLVYLRGQCSSLKQEHLSYLFIEGKPESLQNNFGIWDFNKRHNKHICVPADAGKVN